MANPPNDPMTTRNLDKAATCGEPSYVWRAGQERRLRMIQSAAGARLSGRVLENGCGVGTYLKHLAPHVRSLIGLEFDAARAREAHTIAPLIINAAGEMLPLEPAIFDAILSHEVLEHVMNDRLCAEEMVRVLKPGGVILLFVPNRGYPYETHGVYWRGRYHFGNIPLIHYLPSRWQKALMPHVRAYSRRDIEQLFSGLPVNVLQREIIFGAYDNIIYRYPTAGRILRAVLQWMEQTPLNSFGLSHFWVIEKS
jgi:SAM-dependent methyltransferase